MFIFSNHYCTKEEKTKSHARKIIKKKKFVVKSVAITNLFPNVCRHGMAHSSRYTAQQHCENKHNNDFMFFFVASVSVLHQRREYTDTTDTAIFIFEFNLNVIA